MIKTQFCVIGLMTLLMLNACKQENAVSAAGEKVSATSQKPPLKVTANQPTANGTFCFNKIFNKDVTDVQITLAENKVTGIMNWVPYEKDSARGTLAGVKNAAGEFELIYNYMIEGNQQTETKVMKIEGNNLHIKHGELLDANNDGNLVYKDVNAATYTETLATIPCKAAN